MFFVCGHKEFVCDFVDWETSNQQAKGGLQQDRSKDC
jgi:hypothetical protein